MIRMPTKISCLGFLLALSTINVSTANAAEGNPPQLTIENRINRITATIRQKEEQLQETSNIDPNHVAAGWVDGKRGRDWVNLRRSGWVDGHGGAFVNRNPWRDWRDWRDCKFRNGASFYNCH